jgi:hypothetical protein
MADNRKKKVRRVNDANAGFEAFTAVTAWRLEDSTLSLGVRTGTGRGWKITRAFLEDGKKRIPLSVDTGRSGVAQVWIPLSRSEKGRVRLFISPEDPVVI